MKSADKTAEELAIGGLRGAFALRYCSERHFILKIIERTHKADKPNLFGTYIIKGNKIHEKGSITC